METSPGDVAHERPVLEHDRTPPGGCSADDVARLTSMLDLHAPSPSGRPALGRPDIGQLDTSRDASSGLASSPTLSPRIEDLRAPPGPIQMAAAAEHRVRIHTGAPARGTCGRQSFVSTRGHIDLVPAGTSEEWIGEEHTECLVLTLPRALVQHAAGELGRDPHAAFTARCMLRDPRIEHIAWALDAERSAGGPHGLLYAEALGLALAFHLLGAYASGEGPVGEGAGAPLVPAGCPRRGLSPSERRRLMGYIEDHLDQNLSLSTLARVIDKSPSHLKALFRRSMGLPVHEYVIQRRVERAKTLLLQAELPAAEIALASGFAHQSHMARCMRRVLGLTPTALLRSAVP
jgi:AraC family transcriptional regulator